MFSRAHFIIFQFTSVLSSNEKSHTIHYFPDYTSQYNQIFEEIEVDYLAPKMPIPTLDFINVSESDESSSKELTLLENVQNSEFNFESSQDAITNLKECINKPVNTNEEMASYENLIETMEKELVEIDFLKILPYSDNFSEPTLAYKKRYSMVLNILLETRLFFNNVFDVLNTKVSTNRVFKKKYKMTSKVFNDIETQINVFKNTDNIEYLFLNTLNNPKNMPEYKKLQKTFYKIDNNYIFNLLDNLNLKKLSRYISYKASRSRYKKTENSIAIFEYFILEKIRSLETSIDACMIHLSFLYNISYTPATIKLRQYWYFIVFLKFYFVEGKLRNLNKTAFFFYLTFYIKTFKSSTRTRSIPEYIAFLEYFYKLRLDLQNSEKINEEKLMSVIGMMIPPILTELDLLNSDNFIEFWEQDNMVRIACKYISEVNFKILKNY